MMIARLDPFSPKPYGLEIHTHYERRGLYAEIPQLNPVRSFQTFGSARGPSMSVLLLDHILLLPYPRANYWHGYAEIVSPCGCGNRYTFFFLPGGANSASFHCRLVETSFADFTQNTPCLAIRGYLSKAIFCRPDCKH